MSHRNIEAEKAFRLLAAKIDEVGLDKAPVFLAKLALLLADELNDHARFAHAVARATRTQDDVPASVVSPTAASH